MHSPRDVYYIKGRFLSAAGVRRCYCVCGTYQATYCRLHGIKHRSKPRPPISAIVFSQTQRFFRHLRSWVCQMRRVSKRVLSPRKRQFWLGNKNGNALLENSLYVEAPLLRSGSLIKLAKRHWTKCTYTTPKTSLSFNGFHDELRSRTYRHFGTCTVDFYFLDAPNWLC